MGAPEPAPLTLRWRPPGTAEEIPAGDNGLAKVVLGPKDPLAALKLALEDPRALGATLAGMSMAELAAAHKALHRPGALPREAAAAREGLEAALLPALDLAGLGRALSAVRAGLDALQAGQGLSEAEVAGLCSLIRAVERTPRLGDDAVEAKARFKTRRLAMALGVPELLVDPPAVAPAPAAPAPAPVPPPVLPLEAEASSTPTALTVPGAGALDEAGVAALLLLAKAWLEETRALFGHADPTAVKTVVDAATERLLKTPASVATAKQVQLDEVLSKLRNFVESERSGDKFPDPPPLVAHSTARSEAALTLTAEQQRALSLSRHFAEVRSSSVHGTLLAYFKQAGLSAKDLQKVTKYLHQEAPLTVNVDLGRELRTIDARVHYTALDKLPAKPQPLDLLTTFDTYLNALEVGLSTGNPGSGVGGHRDGKLRDLFRGEYSAAATGVHGRPHYGAINYGRFDLGAAPAFGPCYFELKNDPELRSRVTVLPHDSNYCGPSQVGTLAHLEHVLLESIHYLPEESRQEVLQAMVQGADGKSAGGQPPFRVITNSLKHSRYQELDYLEIQVHGPVDFAHDVAAFVAPRALEGTEAGERLLAFTQKYGIELRWHDAKLVEPQRLPYP